jgi:ankyrin repeat protein
LDAKDGHACTPLHLAATHGNNVMIELLITKGAAIGAKDVAGQTALDLANANGYTASAELLS